MAMAGAPLTREDRRARQVVANKLSLPSDLYIFLDFGGKPDRPAIPAIAAPAPDNPSPLREDKPSFGGSISRVVRMVATCADMGTH